MTPAWRKLTGLVPAVALAEVVLALVASAAGALVYRGFFATLGHLPVLGLACLVGGVTAGVAALCRWRALATPLLAVAGLALVTVYGVFGDTVRYGLPTSRTGAAVLDGALHGWNRMLTVAVPADPWGELLVAPVLVVWAAAFSAVAIVLRTRNVLAPLVPPLLAFLFALLVVGNQAGGHATATVVFLTAALSLIAIRAHRGTGGDAVRIDRQRSLPVAALVTAGLMVAVSALFGIVGGQVLPLASGQHRFDPRDVLAPPITSTDTLTPLATLKSQLIEDPPRTLFTVRIDRDAADGVDRVRTAALDVFDGTTWTSADTYRVAGSHLSVDPALTRSRPVTARVELQELSGPHLPVLGWPSRLAAGGDSAGRLGFDPSSGVVVSATPSLYGLSYDLTGEVSSRDEGLPLALPSTKAPEDARARELPAGMPEPLREEAQRAAGAGSTPYDRLTALEDRLGSQSYELDRPPGHSYAAITRLLTDRDTGTGYAEQHAAAFTVLARAWGYPARVAVGYRLRDYQDGAFPVTTADAHAWPEVHFADYGWVAFEPTTPDNERPPPRPSGVPQVVPPRPTPSTTVLAVAPPASAEPAGPGDGPGLDWNTVLRSSALVLPASLLLVVLGCGGITFVKAHRRRRRRLDPGHAAQVLGAWHELTDRLTERGITPPVSLTFHEVAQHVRLGLGAAAHSVEASAALATTAVYAPEHLDRSDAEQAWRLVAQLHTELYPRRTSAARLRAAVDPRPLWTAWRVTRQRRQAREGLEMGRYR
ncbi:DUF4129 domain-containing protein [Lentzea tibetensis]|uniref:DUF4129 domain-containing protein n=1 Tax=Lentzea tibetensis TaxID=2591470 RepID=A0A563EXQ3_9PSEU|nr:DUF3488 and transglutaminase-like domain-containing protein [Lentzea tibetensis]TWP52510.1 DUF4129 domain-containing protein [Lentzea tibetensis]